jgi:hypothetical protein
LVVGWGSRVWWWGGGLGFGGGVVEEVVGVGARPGTLGAGEGGRGVC